MYYFQSLLSSLKCVCLELYHASSLRFTGRCLLGPFQEQALISSVLWYNFTVSLYMFSSLLYAPGRQEHFVFYTHVSSAPVSSSYMPILNFKMQSNFKDDGNDFIGLRVSLKSFCFYNHLKNFFSPFCSIFFKIILEVVLI